MPRQRLSPLALAPLLLVIFAAHSRVENRTPAAQPPLSGAMATATAPVQPAQTRVRDPHFRALPGATADAGTFSGGVHWIEVPENWNGGLVLYAHGYRGDGPALVVSDPPIRQHLIAGGYTWGLPAVGFAQTPTEKGRALQSVGKYLMGGELPFWREGFAARMTQAANLLPLADPNRQVTPGGRATSARQIQYRIDPGLGYTVDELNRTVRRFDPAPGGRLATDSAVFAELTGQLSAPVISLDTTGDAFVPFSLEQAYRRAADAAGKGDLLVQRGIHRPGHCQFEDGELTRAFDDLVAWIERGVRPEGDDGLDAEDLTSLGLRWTTPLLPNDPLRP